MKNEQNAKRNEQSHNATVNITVTMTRGQHRALKLAARNENTTASALIRRWINDHKNRR